MCGIVAVIEKQSSRRSGKPAKNIDMVKEISKRMRHRGPDEIFGGYLYFRNAPSARDFQQETIDRVQKLVTADCLRADKSTMAHGLEARLPFLDYEGIEKYILRRAFDTPGRPFLPDEILWRQKEQFSDGVGYLWVNTLITYCTAQISDEQMAKAASAYHVNTPSTKEAYYMRSLFHKHFSEESAAKTVKKWIPKWQENQDPSGRANAAHIKADVTVGTEKKEFGVTNIYAKNTKVFYYNVS